MARMSPEVRKFLREKGVLEDGRAALPDLPSDHALRGTPLVGGRRSSAITGSHPERALLKKEQRGRLVLDFPDPLPAPQPTKHTRTRKRLGRRVTAPAGRVW